MIVRQLGAALAEACAVNIVFARVMIPTGTIGDNRGSSRR
jgi:hypothetical protein